MKDYVFLKEPSDPQVDARAIQNHIDHPKVKAVTLATHTQPWVVYLHCHEELTEQERSELAESIANI